MTREKKAKVNARLVTLNILALLVINIYPWKGVANIACLALAWYCIFLFKYAWIKTRICPIAIMSRVSVACWLRAFSLMYKGMALRMKALYFSCMAMVVVKGIVLLFLLVRWLYFVT